MKGTLTTAAVLAGSLLTGCHTMKGADDAFMNLVGPSTQSRISGHYVDAEEVRQYYPLDPQRQSKQRLSYDGHLIPANELQQNNQVDIPMLQAYLQGIVSRLQKGWPGEAPPLKVKLIDSYAFGPFTDAYGSVFVPLGMLDNVESEDEIAAMLGHEISHVLLHHHDRSAAFQEQKSMMVNVATMVVMGASVADTHVDRSSGEMKFTSKNPLRTQNTINKTVLYTALINSFSDNVWSTAWGRAQEDQADLLGADLMIRAGYAPRAAGFTLQRLDDFQGKQKPLLSSFLDERKTAMQASLQSLNLNSFAKEVDVFITSGLTTSITATTQYFNRSHMSPLDRNEDLQQYLQREYRQQRRSQVDKRGWPKVRDSVQVAAALQGYRDASAVNDALAANKLEEAEAFSKRALASPVRDQPGIRRSAYLVHMAQGKRQEALADLNAIKDWSLAAPSVYDLKIGNDLKYNNPQAALAMIDKAETHLGSEELFITEKLRANQMLHNDPQVQAVLGKCAQYPNRKANCQKLVPTKA
ncbi:M48 family metalloprotease [Pseudomonas sp. NPDC090202]|uniref:M48 family metallopeptidase n=1 Tax=unclassified Pseudomonas TaxID=196821 RepID=UPI003812A7EF